VPAEYLTEQGCRLPRRAGCLRDIDIVGGPQLGGSAAPVGQSSK
jgi:hypothetical protein